MTYQVTKTYSHNEGWSTAFRQPGADSHCHYIHGYALAFEFTFECETLDDNNWVLDFGALRPLKAWLQSHFDHKTIIATGDPHLEWFREGHKRGILDLIEIPSLGCESFARLAANRAEQLLLDEDQHNRVRLISVKVSEHSGNSAIYFPKGSS